MKMSEKEKAINTMINLKLILSGCRYVAVTNESTKDIIDSIDYILKLIEEKKDE